MSQSSKLRRKSPLFWAGTWERPWAEPWKAGLLGCAGPMRNVLLWTQCSPVSLQFLIYTSFEPSPSINDQRCPRLPKTWKSNS